MAQTIALLTFSSIIGQMTKAIPGAAARWLFKKGLDSLTGGDESAQIRKDIEALDTQIELVQMSIGAPSKQLNNVLLELRSDQLKTIVNYVSTQYEAVFFALDECLNMPKSSTNAELERKLLDTKIHVKEVLKRCKDELPPRLEDMNALLASEEQQSILALVKSRSLDNSMDFLSYLCKMKTFVMPFWIAEAKALSLLQMAVDAPDIHFAGGSLVVKKYNEYAAAQERVFNKVTGPHVVALAKAVVQNSGGQTPIDLQNHGGKWLKPYDVPGGSHIQLQDKEHPWVLKPVSAVDHPAPEGSYAFELISTEGAKAGWPTAGCSWSEFGASMTYDICHPSWYIKPGQTDKFSFRFNASSMPGGEHSWFQGNDGRYLTRDRYHTHCSASETLDEKTPDQWFFVAPKSPG